MCYSGSRHHRGPGCRTGHRRLWQQQIVSDARQPPVKQFLLTLLVINRVKITDNDNSVHFVLYWSLKLFLQSFQKLFF